MKPKSVEEYLRLPYTIEIIRDNSAENPGWTARVIELPGCLTEADTFQELEAMLDDAMRLWISTALEDGQSIPEPRGDDAYSGKFIVRIPKWLHRHLAKQSDREEISLNQYVGSLLANAVSQASSTPPPQQIDSEALRQMIREEMRSVLESAGVTERTPTEAVEVSVTPNNFDAIDQLNQWKVKERTDEEYPVWLAMAGAELPSNDLRSNTLDRLVNED